jgi:branched-chain amino acid transport system ATP-binding protein
MNGQVVLRVEAADVFYGGFQALRSVSLEVRVGEIVALVGANGAGKSTLLNAVSGLIRPSSGSIEYEGQSIAGKDPSRIVSLGISHVPQGRRVFPDMTVLDNLTLGSYNRHARLKKKENLRLVYDLFPLLERRKEQQAKTLSGGEQQMLALGRGLMSNPKLMLLDEMSLGLAPIVIGKIYRVLREIRKRGITILFVEQSVKRSLQEADRAYIVEAGRVVLEGSVAELREEGEIKKAYFGI